MATRKSTGVERRHPRVRDGQTRTRPQAHARRAIGDSLRARNSSRVVKAPAAAPDVQARLYDALHHFSEALAIVETASSALEAAQTTRNALTSVRDRDASLRRGRVGRGSPGIRPDNHGSRAVNAHDARRLARAFGATLRTARQIAGVSQEVLAERAECDSSYPSLLERGLRTPTLTVFIKIAQALSIEPAELVSNTLERLR